VGLDRFDGKKVALYYLNLLRFALANHGFPGWKWQVKRGEVFISPMNSKRPTLKSEFGPLRPHGVFCLA
jgi:hypothetical protein